MIANAKRCTKCGRVKPVGEFYWNDGKHLKRMSRCKACIGDVRADQQGWTRKTPYGCQREGQHKHPKNWCTMCGQRRWSRSAFPGLCSSCVATEMDQLFGGKYWRHALQRAADLAISRVRIHKANEDPWHRKMVNIEKSVKMRQRPSGECEAKRGSPRTLRLSWNERLRILTTLNTRFINKWHAVMDTKARNWRRKQRKVIVSVKGQCTSVTATFRASEIQMRFDWADADAG